MNDVAIILQARMASQRLSGKVLAKIAGRPVLEHCIERLQAGLDAPLVVATTTRGEDDRVAAEAERLGASVFRGPDEDVLGRFVLVATQLGVSELIRATADNPAVDIDSPRRVLDFRRRTGADHVEDDGVPHGTTVEAMTTEALLRAAALSTDARDREHVTAIMKRDPRFMARRTPVPDAIRRPDLRLTVDTAEDLAFVRDVFEQADAAAPRPVPLTALIAAAERLKGAALSAER